MNFYLLLPLVSCLACTALAVAVLVRDWSRRSSQLAALTAVCAVWWSACELLWNSTSDPVWALRLVRASAFGWMCIGPALLHLFLEVTNHPLRGRAWLPAALYPLPLALAVVDVTTAAIHPGLVRTGWGWGYSVGPLFLLPTALSAGSVALGLTVAWRYLRHAASPAERRQTLWLYAGLAIPLVLATFTDGVLPLLHVQQPRLGAASMTLLVASTAWSFHRYGYALLAPGAFSGEILATLSEGVAVVRPDGRIHTANPGLARLLGTHPRALEGRALDELLDPPLPDSFAELPERECRLLADGREPVPTSIRTTLLRDKQGNPIGLVLVARDLREVESLRSRLITSDRLASLGQLAAGIAHEINNPVTYVRANLGSLRSALDQVESKLPAATPRTLFETLDEGRELIEESLEGVDRVVAIVRDVKTFSHVGEGSVELVEIPRLIDSVLRVAAPQLRGARITSEIEEVPAVRGSLGQLQQVFLNLVINACQASEGGQAIRLSVREQAGRVVVEVSDEGCGIPPEQIGRIFDPFFTTKPVGEGTGLGLSISFQIVQSHQGELTVESQPGRGSCFRVSLPAAS